MVSGNTSGKYQVVQNKKGEILIMIDVRPGGPENPRVVYDGEDTIILYRSLESVVFLRNLDKGARNPIKSVSEVLVAEFDTEDEVVREYKVPMRIVKSVAAIING